MTPSTHKHYEAGQEIDLPVPDLGATVHVELTDYTAAVLNQEVQAQAAITRAEVLEEIDAAIESFHDGEFTVAMAEGGGWCVIDPPLGDCSQLKSLGNGDSPLTAILAATYEPVTEGED